MECKHEFIGTASGVQCKKCGLSMTVKEYGDYVTPPSKKTTTRAKARKGVTGGE